MANLFRVRVALNGFPGAPGVSTFYFEDVATATASLHSMYTVLAVHMPNDVHIQIANSGDVIDAVTGSIVSSWSEAGVSEIVGGGTSGYSAAAGGMIRWETGVIAHGHRIRGRTFLVPLGSDQYSTTGGINDASRAPMEAAAVNFQAEQSASFVVYSRPFRGTPAVGTRPANPARPGNFVLVTAASVPNKSVVLRSRRD